MSQLHLPWDGVIEPPPSTTAESVPTATKDNAAARKCCAAADALEKHIAARHESANRMLALPPTQRDCKKLIASAGEGTRLQRIQLTLRKLAEMHEKGNIAFELVRLTSRDGLGPAFLICAACFVLTALMAAQLPETMGKQLEQSSLWTFCSLSRRARGDRGNPTWLRSKFSAKPADYVPLRIQSRYDSSALTFC